MQEKILIFGNGQIGNAYLNYFIKQGITSKIAQNTDITDKSAVQKIISKFQPTVVINTAAKTNLEWCEQNKLAAFNVNVLGADNIAQVCAQNNIYFIHFSSGCIFESANDQDAKKETDPAAPAVFYSWTKVWSEQLIQKFKKPTGFKYLILRPRQPVSASVHHKNMLIKMLTFTKFIDTPNTGTVIEDLIDWTKKLIKLKPIGILHVANEGWTTPYQIALLLKKYLLPQLPIEKISKAQLDKLTPNKRVDTVLNVEKLTGFGIEVKPYRDRIEEVIKQLAKNIKAAPKKYLAEELTTTAEQSRQRTIVNEVWQNLLK